MCGNRGGAIVEILERVWWRLDRALDAASLAASAELYVAEAVAAGCAGLIDHHESPAFIDGSLDVLADACARFAMPAVLCYGATERNGGRTEAQAGLAVRVAVGLHASFTVSDDTLAEAAALAGALGTVLHVHVAEDGADVADARARGYAGVIDRLARHGALVAGSIFAHGVHLTRAEVAACADAGVWLVQNPRSNRGNQVGYPAALAASTRVALGTDGYPANMADEQAALAELAAAGPAPARSSWPSGSAAPSPRPTPPRSRAPPPPCPRSAPAPARSPPRCGRAWPRCDPF